MGQLPQPPNLPFMASLQNMNRYAVANMGGLDHMGFQIGGAAAASNSGGGAGGGGVEQWRFQQFPFLNNFESTTSVGSYPFQSEIVEAPSGLVGDMDTGSRVTQLPPAVKMEENGALNLLRSSMNVSENNQYYSWTDISGLPTSSSTSHLL